MTKTLKFSAVSIVLATSLMSSSSYAFQGSADDQNACRGDVMNYCMSAVGNFANPNVSAITACLRKNMANLSPACRAVMSRPAKR